MNRNLILLTVLMLTLTPLSQYINAQSENRLLLGYWEPIDEEDHIIVHIYEDQNGTIEGRVIEADPEIDGFENGITASNSIILSGFQHTGEYIWREGEIHDPEDGDTYSGRIKLMHSTKVEVRAYWAFFSKDMTWRKIIEPKIASSTTP